MINEEKDNVRICVINSNTGHIVRTEIISTNDSLITVAKRYNTKDSIVITLTPNSFYCFYISGEAYFFEPKDVEIINFFIDVISGLYDNARDSFHIEYGRVITICKFVNTVVPSKYDTLLACIDNIWETRYYSRYY